MSALSPITHDVDRTTIQLPGGWSVEFRESGAYIRDSNQVLHIPHDEIIKRMARDIHAAVSAQQVPEGWQLVPKGTSWDMRNEAREFLIDQGVTPPKLDHFVDAIYRAMVNAAPKPPALAAAPPNKDQT